MWILNPQQKVELKQFTFYDQHFDHNQIHIIHSKLNSSKSITSQCVLSAVSTLTPPLPSKMIN